MRKSFSLPSILPKRLGLIHVIRTNKIPFLQSRARWPLTVTTVLVIGLGVHLPFSPVATALGFVPLPPLDWGFLFLTLICYMGLTQAVESWLLKKAWA